ncbi:MAG: tRNA epoxyqueuosine(34) reductase QueG [Anaerolineae bacterium]
MSRIEPRISPAALAELVAQAASDLGFDLVGVTPVGPSPDFARFQQWLAAGYDGEMAYLARRMAERADLRMLLPEARSAIVLGASYHTHELPATLRNDPSRGLIAAYAWGDDYHEVIKPLLFQLDAIIRAASGRTSLGRAFVDAGPVLERSWAQEAGLGFIGKNTCLIVPRLGSWTFLAVLLTPEEIAPFSLLASAGRQEVSAATQTCGACVRCLDVCPTNAFVAPQVLDGRRCISYLTIELRGPIPHELRPQMGNWIFGCDLCQQVCPYNRRFARSARLAALQARPEMVAPRLLDLLALDEAGFRQRFRRSPVLRTKRRGLLRNVCVALGNWGDPAAAPALVEALHDDEALVRGHAAWALGRMAAPAARQALLTAAQSEPDSTVRNEINVALTARET